MTLDKLIDLARDTHEARCGTDRENYAGTTLYAKGFLRGLMAAKSIHPTFESTHDFHADGSY